MEKKEKILLVISQTLKKEFKEKCNKNEMTISGRIKHLIKLDIEDKLKLKNENL